MMTKLTSESRRMCVSHRDRPATFLRIEERTKPIPQTARIPQCDECAHRKPKRDASVKDVQVRKL